MDELHAQSVFNLFSLIDGETIEHVKSLIAAIDPDKVRKIMEAIKVNEYDNSIEVSINLKIQK